MGAFYSASVVSAAPAAGAAYADIRSAASGATAQGQRPRIRRIAVQCDTAVSGAEVALYRVTSTNYGTSSANSAGQQTRAADIASGTVIDTAWSGAPTLPGGAVAIDGVSLAGTVGSGYVFTWPEPIELEPNTALLLWNSGAGAGPKLRVTPLWEE